MLNVALFDGLGHYFMREFVDYVIHIIIIREISHNETRIQTRIAVSTL